MNIELFDTIRDYRERVVIPALGDYADAYDTQAIAMDMTQHVGRFLAEVPGLDFWDVCKCHEKEGEQ